MGQKVDLHIHSLYSDGRCRIPEIMQIIKKEAITVFAITDHDTVDGIQEEYRRPGMLQVHLLNVSQGLNLRAGNSGFQHPGMHFPSIFSATDLIRKI